MAAAPPAHAAPTPSTSPDACSVSWDRAGADARGTAAEAEFFVALEQPGPWGRNALRESHLGAELGAALETRCASSGGRFMLLRRPGSHPDLGGPATVLVAHTGGATGDPWLLQACVGSPTALLAIDWDALARGDRAAVAATLPEAVDAPPALLVCTNGRRDICCATRGRPVAQAAAEHSPGRVWESSHTGGHRFAPTAVLLPWGQNLGRLSTELALAVLEESLVGRLPVAALGSLHDRGRAALTPAAQFAESTIRTRLGEVDLAALRTEPPVRAPEPGSSGVEEVVVRHRDGRGWVVAVAREDTGESRPESCGKAAVPVLAYTARQLRELPGHHGRG